MSNKVVTFLDPIILDVTLLEGSRFNLPMFKRDIKIFRGVNNVINFEVKDSDRKAVKILSQEFRILIINNENGELMIEREAEIVCENKGQYKVKLYPGDINSWPSGFYEYTIIFKDFEGDEQVLYVDRAQNPVGTLELIDRPLPDFVPSTEILTNKIHDESNYKVTSIFKGDAQKNFQDVLHSVAFYPKNFTGNLIIQASLEDQARSAIDFFDVIPEGKSSSILTITNSSEIQFLNFEGNFVWVRFKIVADAINNIGEIEKILYKD